MNISGHDSNFAFTRFYDSWTVRSDKSCLSLLFQGRYNVKHVLSGNTISYYDYKLDFSVDRLHNRFFSVRSRDIYDRRLAVSLFLSLCDTREHRQPQMRSPSLIGVDPSDHFRTVLNRL